MSWVLTLLFFLYSSPQCTASFRFLCIASGWGLVSKEVFFVLLFYCLLQALPLSVPWGICLHALDPLAMDSSYWPLSVCSAGSQEWGSGSPHPCSWFSLGSDAEWVLDGGLLSESTLLAVVGDLQWFRPMMHSCPTPRSSTSSNPL